MNQRPSSLHRLVALALSVSLALCSVEPAFAQVRVVVSESLGATAGRMALPSNSALGPAALSGISSIGLSSLASPVAAAPMPSAASLPLSAMAAPAAFPAASAALPAAAPAEAAVRNAVGAPAISPAAASAAPTTALGRDVTSLETVARSVAAENPQADANGTTFFDLARRSIVSAFAVAGRYRGAASQLEPSSSEVRPVAAAQPPAPAKSRSLVKKIAWGAGALALPVLTFGWMSFLKSPAPAGPAVSPYADWGAIARGVAFADPLIALGLWEAAKLYRSKKQGALEWMDRVPAANDLHKPVLPRLNHYASNLAFGAVGIAMMAIFAGPHISDWNNYLNAHSIGLLHWLHVTGWKNVVVSITILDFMGWWWHYACHRFPLMWRLHKVHHSDMEYNFSTTYRTHWAEMAAEIAGRMVMYGLVGPSLVAITIYELIILALSQYQHANIKMPEKAENFLSRFFMTSHKHFIHHSLDKDDYDTNYGFIFAAWDKLFGTFKTYDPDHLSNKVSTGIREYPRAQDLTFFKLLWMPFVSQNYDGKKEKP